jgi:hypothetical protein
MEAAMRHLPSQEQLLEHELRENAAASGGAAAGMTEEDEEGEEGEDEEVDDEELTRSVFEGLANGKKVVTAKDLMNWDIVLELMGEVRGRDRGRG